MGDEVEVEVLDVDLDKERISLSLKATQTDPWQEFANTHQVGELVYGRITKLVPFGAFVQVGDGIEGLVHISEMAVHHVDLPEQVVTPGEELWVKIIDIDLQRRRISLSIKQAAEGGEVSEEYREAFGEHAYDEQGNYIGYDYGDAEFTPETEAQAAWAEYVAGARHAPRGRRRRSRCSSSRSGRDRHRRQRRHARGVSGAGPPAPRRDGAERDPRGTRTGRRLSSAARPPSWARAARPDRPEARRATGRSTTATARPPVVRTEAAPVMAAPAVGAGAAGAPGRPVAEEAPARCRR